MGVALAAAVADEVAVGGTKVGVRVGAAGGTVGVGVGDGADCAPPVPSLAAPKVVAQYQP